MAKFTDEERIEITKAIADYIINNYCSTRKAAEHFKISNATVSTLMNELLPKIDKSNLSPEFAIYLVNEYISLLVISFKTIAISKELI